jgi:hypothetical protein
MSNVLVKMALWCERSVRRWRGKPARYWIQLNYPPSNHMAPRYTVNRPHAAIRDFLDRGAQRYAETLRSFTAYLEDLGRIPARGAAGGTDPYFDNDFLYGIDCVTLYCFLAKLRPRRYVEVGSGHSTRFARRCVQDRGLPTTIVSIDPEPRVGIDRLCDEVVRQPLEEVEPDTFAALEANDVLFIDNSHRCFMNSDVSVCFLDILPRLAPGVVVHLHDIFWPSDYPDDWSGRYYNEQYLLGTLLAHGAPGYEVLLPNAYVASRPDLLGILDPLWDATPALRDVKRGGAGFWMRRLPTP